MDLFSPQARLVRSADYSLREKDDGFVFVHRSGQEVRTDRVARLLWECFPGDVAEAIRRVKDSVLMSWSFLEDYLYVLSQAGILEAEPAERPGAGEGAQGIGIAARSPERAAAAGDDSTASVSVIVVSHDGAEHLGECLQSLRNQSLRPLEVLVVDNASKDGSIKFMRANYPEVRILALRANRHFARAVNYGIKIARGSYLLVLNQDLALDRDCLRRLVEKIRSGEKIAAVAPQMRFFQLRGFVNGIGNHVRNQGWGSDNFIGLVDVGQFRGLREVPSACFGAVLLSREAVSDVGCLDGGYGSYYEDVDWSFRSWFRGWRIVPAPDARVYHKFGGSYLEEKKLRFIVGNRIRLVLKSFQGRILLGFLKRYLREDLKSTAGFIRQKKVLGFLSYARSYFRLALALPRIGVQRAGILGARIRGFREEDILKKNPTVFSGLDETGRPVVDVSMVLGYYRWEIPHPEGEK